MINVFLMNKSNNDIPQYQTRNSAGMDLRAYIDGCDKYEKEIDGIRLRAGERMAIPTGIYIGLPPMYEAQIRPRSGLALKFGITVLNSPGTIDSDYRGEIKVILWNTTKYDYIIRNGDRIAQMVISKYEQAEIFITTELETTERGSGGFGHTGVK